MFQQDPIRNESVVGAEVFSHSGEYAPQMVDLVLLGRGLAFQFIRKYRSGLSEKIGTLGRGWTFTYAKSLESQEKDILYNDGWGRTHRFEASAGGEFRSPDGFYSTLTQELRSYLLRERYGTTVHL